MNLSDKVALVTGAAAGIGLQITRELLKNGIKAVAMLDINATVGKDVLAKLAAEFGKDRVTFIKTDVTDINEMEDAFKKTINSFGTLDIVVNNAGIANDADYELAININLTGILRGTLLGLKYMGKDQNGRGGVILNTASVACFDQQQCFPVYASTKAAVLNMGAGFGHPMYYARTGVKLITLCPGKTTTELMNTFKLIIGTQEECLEQTGQIPTQPVEAVGRAAVHAIKHGESCSVWAIYESKLYQVNRPDWKTFSKHIETYDIPE